MAKESSLDEYFNNSENFTEDEWDRIQKRQMLAGVRTSYEPKRSVKARKGKTAGKRKNWISVH